MALVLVAPPLLAADGRRLTERLSEALPALRVGEDAFLAGPDSWTTGLAVAGAWAVGAWLLCAVLLERRDV
jgi:ABC-2 type transport system permease protein